MLLVSNDVLTFSFSYLQKMPELDYDYSSSPCVPDSKPKKRTSVRRALLFGSNKSSNVQKNAAAPVSYTVPSSHQEEPWGLSSDDNTDSSLTSNSSISDSPPEKQSSSSEDDNSTLSRSFSPLDSARVKWSSDSEELSKYLNSTYGFPSIDKMLHSCFSKEFKFVMDISCLRKESKSLYTSEKWSVSTYSGLFIYSFESNRYYC